MIDIFVRSLLGPWGRQLLDFYLANSLWINGAILLYFGALVISRRTYHQSLAAIVDAVETRYRPPAGKPSRREIKTRLAQDGVPWDAGLRAGAWPLIAGPRSLLPRLKNRHTMEKFFPPEDVAAYIAGMAEAPASTTMRPK